MGNFSGYVIAYCQFQYGHGYSLVFNPNGIGTALGGLFLGPALGNATLRFRYFTRGAAPVRPGESSFRVMTLSDRSKTGGTEYILGAPVLFPRLCGWDEDRLVLIARGSS